MNKTAAEFKSKALESLKKYYDFGDSLGYSNTELSRISSCIKKIDDIPAAAPPPSSEGVLTEGEFCKLHSAMHGEEFDHVDQLVFSRMTGRELYEFVKFCLATLPTMEPEAKEKFAIRFSEWLMIQCDYKNHCVWEYQGEEYTQNELIEIFKRTTPLPSPPKH